MQSLGYLADLFIHLNRSLQGPAVTIVNATEQLKSFLGKLPLWKRRMEGIIFENYSMLEELLTQGDSSTVKYASKVIRKEVSKLLKTLQKSFEDRTA